ncbi:hypothetical protein [Melghirimyces thermohalophilus]|uniref:hypothetical protein n=1 Tax=Melghirimyces thermohalophilus TaxID=1236220 RepID=UPI0015A187BE|nr:hypothetical protein [Melghirimyces thermohalophilus]
MHKLALDIANADDEEKISDLLLELHFQFDSYMWQIDEIHELVKKLAGNCGSPN